MKKISVHHIGNEHSKWRRCLEFYTFRLKRMNGRLADMNPKIADREVAAAIVDFQQRFRKQDKGINQLQQEIQSFISGLSLTYETGAFQAAAFRLRRLSGCISAPKETADATNITIHPK